MGDMMRSSINKKILSLTLNEFINIPFNDMLEMLKTNLDEVSAYSDEYAFSVASAIVKRIFLIKDFSHQYDKFYKIITSSEFKDNKYIYGVLDKNEFLSLRDFFDVYNDNSSLLDTIFMHDEKIFNELVISGDYDIKNIFSDDIINNFNEMSFKKFLSYLLKGLDKNRVIKALLKGKNNKFIYMVSEMDDVVLRYSEDDDSYFDAVLTLLNYNNYRRLLWDYYNKYIGSSNNNKDKGRFRKNIPDELNELLSYTFNLMNVKYATDRVPDIISSMDELLKVLSEGKDMVHIAVFGVEGYKKVKDNTFDLMLDFPNITNDNQLLNLKIAFFGTIYGITYNQAEKLIKSFENFMKEFVGSFDKNDRLIYETIVAMKSLYNLTLDDKDGINLYREVYYKYIKKNGIYATVEISALVIMEKLMRRMYNNSIEIL